MTTDYALFFTVLQNVHILDILDIHPLSAVILKNQYLLLYVTTHF